MKGDFTRNTFYPSNRFTQVLMQQGRVLIDADWNEQVAILLYYLRSLAADLIGEHGGPTNHLGFEIITDVDKFLVDHKDDKQILSDSEKEQLQRWLPLNPGDFVIGKGSYYVGGVLVGNEAYVLYSRQADWPAKLSESDRPPFLVYLDVWERHITSVENPSIRDVALGGPDGPDTATRTQLVWQVKTKLRPTVLTPRNVGDYSKFLDELGDEIAAGTGQLKARAKAPAAADTIDPCIISPDSSYRRAENQLYRVEVHKGGTAAKTPAASGATFKWSRENGSVIFPIERIIPNKEKKATTVKLRNLGRDARFNLEEEDWVELLDDDYVRKNSAGSLLQVEQIDPDALQVTLKGVPEIDISDAPQNHPLLRRWDQKSGDPRRGELRLEGDGTAKIIEGHDETYWLGLEDGVQIQFQSPAPSEPERIYRTGDYWLIPARTATGDVEWPQQPDGHPAAVLSRRIKHYYAPLALVGAKLTDSRRHFGPLAELNS